MAFNECEIGNSSDLNIWSYEESSYSFKDATGQEEIVKHCQTNQEPIEDAEDKF